MALKNIHLPIRQLLEPFLMLFQVVAFRPELLIAAHTSLNHRLQIGVSLLDRRFRIIALSQDDPTSLAGLAPHPILAIQVHPR